MMVFLASGTNITSGFRVIAHKGLGVQGLGLWLRVFNLASLTVRITGREPRLGGWKASTGGGRGGAVHHAWIRTVNRILAEDHY